MRGGGLQSIVSVWGEEAGSALAQQGLSSVRDSHPSTIVADLNAFLLSMEQNIADFAAVLGCADVEQRFRQLAANRWAPGGPRLGQQLLCSCSRLSLRSAARPAAPAGAGRPLARRQTPALPLAAALPCRREALDALFWGPEDSQWHDLVCTPAGVAPAAEAAAGVAEAEAPSTGQGGAGL